MKKLMVLSLLVGSSLLGMEGEIAQQTSFYIPLVCWINDNTIATVSSVGSVSVWDIQNLNQPQHIYPPLNTGNSMVHAVAYNGVNQMIATVSHDIKLWHARNGMLLATFGGSVEATSLSWNPDGTRLASSSLANNEVTIWSIFQDGRVDPWIEATYPNLRDNVQRISWSPDGRSLAIGFGVIGHSVELWTTEKPYKIYRTLSFGKVMDLSWGDSMRIAISWAKVHERDKNAIVRLYNTNGNTMQTLEHANTVFAVACYYYKGTFNITTGSQDKNAYVWEQPDHIKFILKGHTGCVKSVAYNQDCTMVATASEDGTIRVWSMGTGACLSLIK